MQSITGLEPIRSSSTIEHIDLTLVGDHEELHLIHDPSISCEKVLPILDSIIEGGGCAVKRLHFPWVWRKDQSGHSDLHHFISRYNAMRSGRDREVCLKCNDVVPDDGEWIYNTNPGYLPYATLCYTCYECEKHYCHDCMDDDGDRFMLGNCCRLCERAYCLDCRSEEICACCGKSYCCTLCASVARFTITQCRLCTEMICNDCESSAKHAAYCVG